MSLVALLLVLILCWVGMAFMGDWYHNMFGSADAKAPDDPSALLLDPSLTKQAPCDTCDGVGGGQINGELVLCPDCLGTGIVSPS